MELLETMRAEAGAIALLDRHLDRLSNAASHHGYPYDRSRIRDDLSAALAGRDEALQVRLTLDANGRVEIGLVPMDRVPRIRSAAIVAWPTVLRAAASRFKTTDRAPYDAALDEAWAAGSDEALLVDENGLVVEATRANVWVRRGGDLVTPPVDNRGLAGVMRAELLDTLPGACIGEVTAQDLRVADEVLLSNAVRGLFRISVGTNDDGGA